MADPPDAKDGASAGASHDPPAERESQRALPALQSSHKSINPYAFSIAVASIVILTKIASYLTPYKLYFTFSSFIYAESHIFRWESLAIKLIIPMLVGFSLYFFPFHWMRITKGSRVNYRIIYRYLSRQSELSARAAGFFSALLMAWPFIIYWDIMMRPDMLNLRFPFLLVYFLYFLSYMYFAGLGVALCKLLLSEILPATETSGISARVSWLEGIRTSALGLMTSAIATYFASTLGTAP
jgi:hypothetical protein